MPINPWKTLRSIYLVRDQWMTLRADTCALSNGKVLETYYVNEPPDWVQVVAFDREDRVLTTRQYRHGVGMICTELPCGVIDADESPADAARRELLEETGCTVETLEALPTLSPNAARFSNRVHSFVATGARQLYKQQLDDTEEIEFEFLTLEEVFTLIDTGVFLQALHIASLCLALRKLQEKSHFAPSTRY